MKLNKRQQSPLDSVMAGQSIPHIYGQEIEIPEEITSIEVPPALEIFYWDSDGDTDVIEIFNLDSYNFVRLAKNSLMPSDPYIAGWTS